MNRRYVIANALLWGAAIVAAALSGASMFYTTILLPSLAVSALLFGRPPLRAEACRTEV